MHETLDQVRLFLRYAWRRRWLCLGVAWPLAILGWAMVVLLPDQYQSTARIYADADSLLAPLIKDEGGVDITTQLQLMQRSLLSRPNLLKLIEQTPLAARAENPAATERVLAALQSNIQIRHEGANVYAISYWDRDSATAAAVVHKLVEIFPRTGFGASRESAEAARQFIDAQIELQERSLREAETRLAEFQKKHVDFVPGQKSQAERLNEARDQAIKARSDLEAARAQRDVLSRQLRAVPATLPSVAVPNSATALPIDSPAAQLLALRRRLAELTSRYTDRHPDVQATQRAIADLEVLIASSGRRGGTGIAGVPNPLYEQLRLNLAQREAEIASLQNRVVQADQVVAEMSRTARVAPETEAEFKRLARDYEVIKKQYEQLVAQRESVRIATDLGEQADRVDFRVVDPAQAPLLPASPPRLPLLAVVLVASLAAGMGLAVTLGMLARPFETPRALQQAYGAPVLGCITEVLTQRGQSRARWERVRFAFACLALLGLFAAVVSAERAELTEPLRASVLALLAGRPVT